MVDTAIFTGDLATDDVKKVANRIVDIIISPGVIPGLINGALTVPLDLGYLAIGYFDTDSRSKHQAERIRMAEAIHNDILNYDHITNAVELIFERFNQYLTISQQNSVYRGVVSSVAGRLVTAKIITSIGAAVLTRISFIGAASAKGWIGKVTLLLLVGGMSERSISVSEELAIEAPEIYQLLRPHDYDLSYFLFEPVVKPFVEAIHIANQLGQPYFNKIIEIVESKLNVN
ncbi:hypothetical protein NB069_02670 [Leclercia adecarboxylata]|uniref:hypothetical protein n=1 Tax=Leclercia adecarboxylata TaxID=83655 RepID=UPI00202A80E0|nr:hypothetical protein [Leclercia adecarboxylata]URN99807.1 hypothetical protein NB069_02670 [Leclercia adecarboxylata]